MPDMPHHLNPIFEQTVDTILAGNAAALRQLLAEYPAIINTRSTRTHHATLLHYVVTNGLDFERQQTPPDPLEISRILLEAGANPNSTSALNGGGNKSTPLLMLVTRSHPAESSTVADLVRLFCQYGNPNGVADNGLPLSAAIWSRNMDAARALAASGARVDNIVHAAALGAKAQVRSMLLNDSLNTYLDHAENLHTEPQRIKEIALVAAAMAGELAVVELLVEHGVNYDAPAGFDNRTALQEACLAAHLPVVNYLLAHGADVSTGDEAFINRRLEPFI